LIKIPFDLTALLVTKMARNIEITARISNFNDLAIQVAALADSGPFLLFQQDTFFNCTTGFLKLRTFSQSKGELIYYQRPSLAGPKLSNYNISPTPNPDSLKLVLDSAFGILGTVIKKRTLYLSGQTRIHLDQVEGLGDFLEIEVVLGENETAALGETIAQNLLDRLKLLPDQLVSASYLELLKS